MNQSKTRRKRVLGAGALAAVLLAGGGFAAQAQAGDTAAPGQKAAKRSSLVLGYEVVRLPNKNVGRFQRRVAECPKGMHVIGGGAEARGNQAILVGSFPTDDNTGWIGLGRQPGAGSVGISVFAICSYTLTGG